LVNDNKQVIHYISNIREIKNFKFKDEFIRKWENYFDLLNEDKDKLCLVDTNLLTDYDQFFSDKIILDNMHDIPIEVSFNFQIAYINKVYENHKNAFPIIKFNISNNKIFNNSMKCIYDESYLYKDLSDINNIGPIYAITWPIDGNSIKVIDGNHRVCKAIQNNEKTIEITYVDLSLTAYSMYKISQAFNYLMISDTQKIIFLKEKYKGRDNISYKIYEELLINSHEIQGTLMKLIDRCNN
jgi:hypothetical protein